MTASQAKPTRVAFYAPMKSPNHATPSGDRRIARLTIQALRLAGFDPIVVSDVRTLDMQGNAEAQKTLMRDASAECERLARQFESSPPALWFTYHCYYKAPDLLGPELAGAFGIPYAISEPSISPSRRNGDWARFAEISEAAIAKADALFWTTARDRPALAQAGHTNKMVHLKAFVETADTAGAAPRDPHHPLRLLTVAMMRPGDKVESYRRLAAALAHLQSNWELTVIGDGSERGRVEAFFEKLPGNTRFFGQIDSASKIEQAFRDADLFVWPGVGEGVGMVYLEAQAAGVPVVAEDHPAPSDVIANQCVTPNDPKAFAERVEELATLDAFREASLQAQRHIAEHHSLQAAASTLSQTLRAVLQ